MWHAWERRQKCTSLWWESLKERDHSETQGTDGRMDGSYGDWLGSGLDSSGSG
jgi:hypothetical protein